MHALFFKNVLSFTLLNSYATFHDEEFLGTIFSSGSILVMESNWVYLFKYCNYFQFIYFIPLFATSCFYSTTNIVDFTLFHNFSY